MFFHCKVFFVSTMIILFTLCAHVIATMYTEGLSDVMDVDTALDPKTQEARVNEHGYHIRIWLVVQPSALTGLKQFEPRGFLTVFHKVDTSKGEYPLTMEGDAAKASKFFFKYPKYDNGTIIPNQIIVRTAIKNPFDLVYDKRLEKFIVYPESGTSEEDKPQNYQPVKGTTEQLYIFSKKNDRAQTLMWIGDNSDSEAGGYFGYIQHGVYAFSVVDNAVPSYSAGVDPKQGENIVDVATNTLRNPVDTINSATGNKN